jgi:hypothetical protein
MTKDHIMIVEQRIYTIKPGMVGEYLKLYKTEGLEVQMAHLGRLVGYYSVEIGPLNQIIHMWAYEDADDRTARRSALYADPLWQQVVAKLLTLIDRMENIILKPTKFAEPQTCQITS